jgi:DNA-binding CsgD family transcriptional regulator/PAS domain-containing protein
MAIFYNLYLLTMKPIIPDSYQELIAKAASFSNYPRPKAQEILTQMGYQATSLHAQAPMFYVVDYCQRKYLYIDPSAKLVLGYEPDYLQEAGPLFYIDLWNKEDYQVYNEKILPQTLYFLRGLTPEESVNYSFSCNYRVKTKAGSYITLLQRSTYFVAPEERTPVAAVGFALDITHFKDDTRMLFTIEKVNRNFFTLSAEPIFKAIYYPDKENALLSKRELEVLQLIYEGCSSKEIASRLFLSLNTVNNHRKNMLEKTGSRNASELIYYARKKGIL